MQPDTDLRLIDKLQHLQFGKDTPILLFTQDPTGLGGQISRRLVGLKLSLLSDRKVVFPHRSEPPYDQVFESIHSDVDYDALSNGAIEVESPTFPSDKLVKLDFWRMWNDPTFRQRVYDFVPDDLRACAEPTLYFDGLLLSFCRLIREHQVMVANEAERFGIGDDTLGVHVRRGDKSVETPYVPLSVINNEIRRLCAQEGFRQVFACSDDPSIFTQLEMPPGVELVYDKDEIRYNNANHRLLMKDRSLATQETRTAVKNIYLLGRCGGIIGQSNAHFATLAGSQISYRRKRFVGSLVDGEYALKRSPATRFYYGVRRGARSAAKWLLPGLTLRQVKARIR